MLAYVAPNRQYAIKLARALRPGGAIGVEDRHVDSRKVWPEGTYHDNELLSLFPGLRVIQDQDVWDHPDWQAQHLEERILRMLAAKPGLPRPGCLWEGRWLKEVSTVCWDRVRVSMHGRRLAIYRRNMRPLSWRRS